MPISKVCVFIILIACVMYVQAQQQTGTASQGAVEAAMISVPLRPGEGLEYEIQFVPTRAGVRAIASRFCDERKGDFNITNEYINACLEPIIYYLDTIVSRKIEIDTKRESDVIVPLKIADFEYEISFAPNPVSATEVARQFCTERGPTFGINENNFENDCMTPISEYFTRSLQEHIDKYSSYELPDQPSLLDDTKIMMEVQGITFELSWNSKNTTPEVMARRFCLSHAEQTLNIDYTACVLPVEDYLLKSTASPEVLRERRMIKAIVNIADTDFEFKFGPEDHEALRAAQEFCREKGPALGVVKETEGSQCVQPVLVTLLEAIERAEIKRREKVGAV